MPTFGRIHAHRHQEVATAMAVLSKRKLESAAKAQHLQRKVSAHTGGTWLKSMPGAPATPNITSGKLQSAESCTPTSTKVRVRLSGWGVRVCISHRCATRSSHEAGSPAAATPSPSGSQNRGQRALSRRGSWRCLWAGSTAWVLQAGRRMGKTAAMAPKGVDGEPAGQQACGFIQQCAMSWDLTGRLG